MSITDYVPLEQISVSGAFTGTFYPVWINDWGQASVNTDLSLTLEGWLLQGESATGPIIANYVEEDYDEDPNREYFLARKSYIDQKVAEAQQNLTGYLLKSGGILNTPINLTKTDNVPDDGAITVGYVDDVVDQYLRTEGVGGASQTMSGGITLHSTLNEAYGEQEAITARYVEDAITTVEKKASDVIGYSYVPLSGGTVDGHISVPDPVNDCDAATLKFMKEYLAQKKKEYFDSKTSNTGVV